MLSFKPRQGDLCGAPADSINNSTTLPNCTSDKVDETRRLWAPRERMLQDIYRLCAVSTFFKPESCNPWRLKGKELGEYLDSSANRLAVLDQAFAALGYTPSYSRFHYADYGATNAIYSTGQSSEREIWFVAHHDHRAALGAEDNGTALAVMIELAERFRGTPIEASLRFASFDLEEMGCKGSYDFVSKLSSKDLGRIACVIDLECLGSGPHIAIAKSVGKRKVASDPELVHRLEQLASSLGYDQFVSDDLDFFIADHVPFAEVGVPTVSLYSLDYAAYRQHVGHCSNDRIKLYGSVAHSAEDIPARIELSNLERTASLLENLIQQNAGVPFAETPRATTDSRNPSSLTHLEELIAARLDYHACTEEMEACREKTLKPLQAQQHLLSSPSGSSVVLTMSAEEHDSILKDTNHRIIEAKKTLESSSEELRSKRKILEHMYAEEGLRVPLFDTL